MRIKTKDEYAETETPNDTDLGAVLAKIHDYVNGVPGSTTPLIRLFSEYLVKGSEGHLGELVTIMTNSISTIVIRAFEEERDVKPSVIEARLKRFLTITLAAGVDAALVIAKNKIIENKQ